MSVLKYLFRRSAAGVLIAAAMASSACYRYVPISLGTVASSADVRVRITQDAAARLVKDLGVFSTEIDGQVAPQGPDSVSLGVEMDRSYRGTTVGTATQMLLLGRGEVVDVRKREFSRGRTILLSTGAVVGFGLLAGAVVQLTDPNPPPGNSHPLPPATQSRVPPRVHFALRIPFP